MKRGLPTLKLSLFIFLIAFSYLAGAQITKLTDLVGGGTNGRVANDAFGYSTAISGDVAVISAVNHPYDVSGGDFRTRAGAIYIFYRNEGGANNWGFRKKIVPTGNRARRADDAFGFDVAIWDDIIVVGAPYHWYDAQGNNSVTRAGAAFVFQKNEGGPDNWGQTKILVPEGTNERTPSDAFGWSVSVSGDNIIVGATFKNHLDGPSTVLSAGAAYIFNKDKGGANNWGQVKKLKGEVNGNVEGGLFGYSVVMHNDDVVVSATVRSYIENGDTAFSAGAAYVFNKNKGGANNWGLVKTLTSEGTNEHVVGDWFGYATAINGGTIVIGAKSHDFNENGSDSIPDAGAAYVFHKNKGGADNWGFVKKLVAGTTSPARGIYDNFGEAVAVSGSTIIIASQWADHYISPTDTILGAGAVYVYYKDQGGADNWGLKEKLEGSGINGQHKFDNFGSSVAISGNSVIVGTSRQDYNANGIDSVKDAGKSTVFLLDNITSVRDVMEKSEIYVAAEGKNIHLNFTNNEVYTITVYDLMGRKVAETKTDRNKQKIISLPQVSTGYYLVKISNDTSQQVFKTFLH